MGHLDGSLCAPTTTIVDKDNKSVSNLEYTAWLQIDQLVVSLLLSSLPEEAMSQVVWLNTSNEVYVALQECFSHRSKSRELQLKGDL